MLRNHLPPKHNITCNSFSNTPIPRANAAMGEKVHGDMAEKDAAVPAAWYLAPVPHRRDPSQCIHVSIRLWIVLTHHHSSLSWKLPKLPALHYGRCMWTPPGHSWCSSGRLRRIFDAALTSRAEQPEAGEHNLWSKRSLIFNEREVVIWDRGLFWGVGLKNHLQLFAEYRLCSLLFLWAIHF